MHKFVLSLVGKAFNNYWRIEKCICAEEEMEIFKVAAEVGFWQWRVNMDIYSSILLELVRNLQLFFVLNTQTSGLPQVKNSSQDAAAWKYLVFNILPSCVFGRHNFFAEWRFSLEPGSEFGVKQGTQSLCADEIKEISTAVQCVDISLSNAEKGNKIVI